MMRQAVAKRTHDEARARTRRQFRVKDFWKIFFRRDVSSINSLRHLVVIFRILSRNSRRGCANASTHVDGSMRWRVLKVQRHCEAALRNRNGALQNECALSAEQRRRKQWAAIPLAAQ